MANQKYILTKAKLEKFTQENDLFLHPEKNLDAHIRRYNQRGFCPCTSGEDPTHIICPCDGIWTDLKKYRGSCKCSLFVTKEYMKRYGYL